VIKVRKQNTTNYPISFLMTDSSDHITGKTSASPTITLSKNGTPFGASSGSISELSYGWYSFYPSVADLDTLGDLSIHISGSGADPSDILVSIVNYDPFKEINTISASVALIPTTSTSASAIASTVWSYANRSLTSFGNILSSVASTVWNHISRTLTDSSVTLSVEDNTISTIRGDTLIHVFSNIDFTGYEKVYFTVKDQYKDADSESLIQISDVDGLLFLNSASCSGSGATLIIDEANESATLQIEAEITKEFGYKVNNYVYDLQIIRNTDDVITPESGTFIVVRDVTKSII